MSFRTTHLLIAAGVFLAEILVATRFSRVPFVRSFLGDYLVAILVYHFLKAFREFRPFPLACAVFGLSCSIEVSQYFHLADALGLQRGSLPSIVLGNSFSWLDILMYLLGSATSYLCDVTFLTQAEHSSADALG